MQEALRVSTNRPMILRARAFTVTAVKVDDGNRQRALAGHAPLAALRDTGWKIYAGENGVGSEKRLRTFQVILDTLLS
jgi:hypothetical protein